MDLHGLEQQLESELASIDAERTKLETAQHSVKSFIRENREKLRSSISTGTNENIEALDQDRQRLALALQAIQRKIEDLEVSYSTVLHEHRDAVLNYEIVIEQERIEQERIMEDAKQCAKLEEKETRKGEQHLKNIVASQQAILDSSIKTIEMKNEDTNQTKTDTVSVH